MDALKAAGAVGFTDDGIPLMDQKLVRQAMLKAKELDVPLSFHEEDPAFISENGIHAGEVAKALGIQGSPALAEDALVARDCMLALHTGASVNIQHISSVNSVRMVKLAKELGADVTAEVTPPSFHSHRERCAGAWSHGENEPAAAYGKGQTGNYRGDQGRLH